MSASTVRHSGDSPAASKRPETSVLGATMVVDSSEKRRAHHPLISNGSHFTRCTLGSHTHLAPPAGVPDKSEHDAEETRVIASNRSSAHLLSNPMSPYSAIHWVA